MQSTPSKTWLARLFSDGAHEASQRRPPKSRSLTIESLETRWALAAVTPTVTTPSLNSADDPAIWIHPTDTSKSTVIGTDKSNANGLRIFNLTGAQIQAVGGGAMNNVDVRYQFPLGGTRVSIVAASNLTNNSISVFRVDPATGFLQDVAARTITVGGTIPVYGFALYHEQATDKFYAFLSYNDEDGKVEQWELFDNGANKIDAVRVRTFDVGSRTEGMVADDQLGWLYLAEETVGIWQYSAAANAGVTRTRVDTGAGQLFGDVEGLAIYYGSGNTGYLLASSQANDDFKIYRREGNHAFVGAFSVTGASHTDGIDVINVGLGTSFSQGLFVTQNDNVNFKFVPWQSIASTFSPNLMIDKTSWDPRSPAGPPTNQPPQVNAGTDRSASFGTIVSLDATVSDDGLPSGQLLPLWTVDSGPGNVTFNDNRSIDTTVEFTAEGVYQLRLTVGDGALSATDVVQVTISQQSTTVQTSFQDGVSGGGQFRGTRDTTLLSTKPTKNKGSLTSLTGDGVPDKSILLKWDISTIPQSSTVQSAEITVQVTGRSKHTYVVYGMLRNWDEATSTWQRASTGVNWASPGAQGSTDRGQTVLGTLLAKQTGAATIQLNTAGLALVQSWINNPNLNFGIKLQGDDNSDAIEIASREAWSGRPKLNIVYAPPAAPISVANSTEPLAIAAGLEVESNLRKRNR